MKPPHLVTGGGRRVPPAHHHPGGKPPPGKKPPPSHHKKPPKPRKPPKPVKTKVHRKPRGWSPGSDVACCSAEALGTLLGWGWDDVLALYWRTASDPDEGATILDTLTEALPYGHYAGLPVQSYTITGGPFVSSERDSNPHLQSASAWLTPAVLPASAFILGVTLPEPHAVAVTPDGTWWSWGEPFNPAAWPDLTIEEAWAVTWPR